ncbi:MAG: DUF2306 domain-containing protein, partial [Bacteroidota bacterium]
NLPKDLTKSLMQWTAKLLVGVVWISALLFGLYIFIFYFIGALKGDISLWNEGLSNLYREDGPSANIGIGAHFAAGSVILILGCIQLISSIRLKFPVLHRWLGRLYVMAAILTAVGGLTFIFTRGTIGGLPMDIAFTGYGLLTFLSAVATIYYARSRDFSRHRAWAIRLYALAIGSWLYRMDYGFWLLFTGGWGHNGHFNGPFDIWMDFFFYLPNLLVAEIFIGRYKILQNKPARGLASVGMLVASAFLILATYFFTKKMWLPSMIQVIDG